ncbi:sulfate permease [Agromyces seonyuensis]|uniref:Sulfate permease n=1 Tax=Agromyces seonyuensis TaxID=2662446 RepID=A0A6I4NYS8_9MICO|nr:sulfate permease [Agromyces seonyuensis]MWB99428.1 sulfate permease [Agromyces seonyuensis]
MFALITLAGVRAGLALRRMMPTNLLLDALHTRRGLKWGPVAMLLAVPYLLGAFVCAGLAGQDGAGWLDVLVLLCFWNAMKFLIAGPATLLRLLVVRRREAQIRRRVAREFDEASIDEVEPELVATR